MSPLITFIAIMVVVIIFMIICAGITSVMLIDVYAHRRAREEREKKHKEFTDRTRNMRK